MKKLLDFILALCLFIILSPILIIISIIIKMNSRGPIFFKQRRIGVNKREFLIFKFRTMKTDTPDLATDELKDADTYITNVGSFLRKTSLDELPQLINILKGEMSFVGPRPALYNQYDLIESRDKKGVNACAPGITGYAQVNGRDMITDDEKVKLDEYYLNNKSLILDLKITIKTFLNVIMSKDISK